MESNFADLSAVNNRCSLIIGQESSLEDVRNCLLCHGVSEEACNVLYGKTKQIKFFKEFF